MTECTFQSSLAKRIESFIALKQLSGTPYTTPSLILMYFDRFLVREKFKRGYLTKPIYERYVATLSNLSPQYRADQRSLIRRFSIYLSRFAPRCYIPDPGPVEKPQKNWRAYIFSKDQIQSLLAAAGKLRCDYRKEHWLRPHTYRTLFGLLYTTGMRIGETLALNIEDFHPDTLRLHIRAGKFHKARWVPLSRSTSMILTEYVTLRQRIIAKGNGSPPLFINQYRTRLGDGAVYLHFDMLLKQCGIYKSRKRGPRIHDLRHTFAVHRLLEWYRDGEDINVRLPALATYMGHVEISSTQVYLQATPELYEYASNRFLTYVHNKRITKGSL
ncbi:tyrosine-type recombinase/integrase [Planctomycetota bacterium]